MDSKLTHVIRYFSFFSYAPTFLEIHTFYPVKITQQNLKKMLTEKCKLGTLVQLPTNIGFILLQGSNNPYSLIPNPSRYTLPQYSIHITRRQKLEDRSNNKVAFGTIHLYISLLKCCPLVRFVGVTGKSAMEGIRAHDDIDLFIITKKGLLWTTRLYAVLMAKLLRIHGGSGVCLNLFFDERDLNIPTKKQNKYIAHELLQLKPIVDKGAIYTALLNTNEWIFRMFPNSRSVILGRSRTTTPESKKNRSCIGQNNNYPLPSTPYTLEVFCKSIQIPIIHKNKTAFRITPTQLWLFRSDFEKKLKKNRLSR